MHVETEGLILRETAYKDYDKMLTIFSKTEGKISVSARGARRRNSQFTASTQILAYGNYSLYLNHDRYQLDDAETLDLFFALRQDLALFSLGSYFAELLETVCAEGVPQDELFRLSVFILRVLVSGKRDREIVKAAFELKLLALAGYEPFLEHCPVCGQMPDVPAFHLKLGVLHCVACRPFLDAGATCQLSDGVFAAMQYILECEPAKLCSFTLGESDRLLLASLCEQFTELQLERRFPSLEYYRGII